MPIPENPDLYDKVKKLMDKRYDKPSAYKSGAIVKLYKELGGTYIEDGKERDLERWFKETWENVADKGQYPVLRPTKRINKNTPLTITEIDKDNLKEQIKLKQKIKGNLPPFEGGAIRTDKIQKLTQSAYKKNKDLKDFKNYKLDRSLSTNEVKVWVNANKQEVVVSNRGSQYTLKDWLNNAAYVVGNYKNTQRYNNAKEIQMKVKAKYPNYKITNLGHSQGAVITRQLNKEGLTDEVINTNPATLYADRKNKDNEYTLRSKGDIISMFHSKDKNTIEIDNKTINPLTEHKTTIINRIPKQMIGTGFIEP
jgi:hypothetical protein